MSHYVVYVHGMGDQKLGCSKEFRDLLNKAFKKEAKKAKVQNDSLVWKEVFWANITQPDQQKLMKLTKVEGLIRNFMVGSLGDVVAYSKLPYPPDKYGEIQKQFVNVISEISQEAEKASDEAASLDVVAHSLGSVIASDGIYNLIKSQDMPNNLSLGGFFSMGSPISLFGLRYGLSNFTKPIQPKRWINFYYTKDLIGFPLRTLNEAYKMAVEEDFSLNSGGGLNIWSTLQRKFAYMLPLAGAASHSWYGTDSRVIKKIAEVLVNI